MYPGTGVALHLHCQKKLIGHRIEIIKNILYFKIHKHIIKKKSISYLDLPTEIPQVEPSRGHH
jgi:hypothetical protein